MDDESRARAARIFCIEQDTAVLESRCAVLKLSQYDVMSALPQTTEVMLRGHKFDLIVISGLSGRDVQRIVSLADGAELMVLDELTMPSELLDLVSQRLNRQRRA